MRLLRTSHLGPTLVVSLVSYLLAIALWWEGPALVIALTIFTGQLCVGWTNDLVDVESDREQRRAHKPIANGEISISTVRTSTFIALALCIALSFFGPLGIRGGLVHLLGVGCGVAYNFYLKANLASPIAYIIAFAALPSCIVLSKYNTVPLWLVAAGSLFGIAAHFANVLKDMERDRSAGVMGFPQRVGSGTSSLIAGTSLMCVSIILTSVTGLRFSLIIGTLAFIALFAVPMKARFVLILLLALTDVVVLVTFASSSVVTPL